MYHPRLQLIVLSSRFPQFIHALILALTYPVVGFRVAQMVKNLPAIQEVWVQSLDQEYPLEKGMATYSSILVWEIP